MNYRSDKQGSLFTLLIAIILDCSVEESLAIFIGHVFYGFTVNKRSNKVSE